MIFGKRPTASAAETKGAQNPPGGGAPQNRISLAASQFVALLMQNYKDANGVHAETIIGAAAAVAGDSVKDASGLPVCDAQFVVNGESEDLLVGERGSGLALIAAAVGNAGGDPRSLPSGRALLARMAAAVGGPSYPPLSVDRSHYPHEYSPQAATRFRAKVCVICAAQGIVDPKEIFVTCALATAMLITVTAKTLDPVVAGTLALEMMFGVSRMNRAALDGLSRGSA
jgi:hypothetical protein